MVGLSAYFYVVAVSTSGKQIRYTVQFRSICHPYVTVTHLTKFSFRHLARRAVTRSKFRQMAQILTRIALFGTYVMNYPFVKQPCDV